MTPAALSPAETRTAIGAGARLVDIRGADEHARERIPGAVNVPIDRIDDLPRDGRPVVFHCKSGMRTAANAARLAAAAAGAPAYIMSGGIDAWRDAGQATVVDRSQPLEIMRQVQIAAGALVLAGVLLGLLVAPAFFGLAAFVGAGLMFAGLTGWCGMANLLRVMPWNRRAAA
ncbi:rhodanese-like domain-containing protein [Sphingomonas sanxanigenens]|uniref:Membrane protein n=1 Tax=Sphingomonas sanxanigenens DSM 19645 = NX02 TaxID=1123269 RepID=W0A897_9SPHN|nr:rhodanese-like domain-containing protein [Sphingomonas sanxanigenens]AHE52707.1 membrane protein [Sphingomonas sanxanigenens DSM 19645 = NX02]